MCKVVLLDGASSAGKTSLAIAFQDLVTDRVVYRHSLDDFLNSLPSWFLDRILRFGDKDGLDGSLSRFHRMVSASTKVHDVVIVDHVFQNPAWRDDFFYHVDREDTLYVQVYCPLAVLECREKERGDRDPGMAREQFSELYGFTGYDLQIDTSEVTSARGARLILDHRDGK